MILYIQTFNFMEIFSDLLFLIIVVGFLFVVNISHSNFWSCIFSNNNIIKNIIAAKKWYGLAFCTVFLIMYLYLVMRNEIQPLIRYKTNNYEIVEGYVENFQEKDNGHTEEFAINNIKFSYRNKHGIGYNDVKEDDGVIEGNGQHLKIGYYYSKNYGNVIVYIEELE